MENCLTTYDPHAFVLVYSITDCGSFQFAEGILKYLWQESCTKEKAVILVGNKVDLARSRMLKCEGTPRRLYRSRSSSECLSRRTYFTQNVLARIFLFLLNPSTTFNSSIDKMGAFFKFLISCKRSIGSCFMATQPHLILLLIRRRHFFRSPISCKRSIDPCFMAGRKVTVKDWIISHEHSRIFRGTSIGNVIKRWTRIDFFSSK